MKFSGVGEVNNNIHIKNNKKINPAFARAQRAFSAIDHKIQV